jgi:hypothetical protein
VAHGFPSLNALFERMREPGYSELSDRSLSLGW